MFDFLKSGGTPGSGPPDKKELSVEMRLLLAFILMGAVLFTTPYFFKAPPAPPAAAKKAEPTPAPAASQSQAAQASGSPETVAAASASAAAAIAGQKEESFTLETDLYRILFSNRGGVVQSWVFKKYKDPSGKPLEVVNTAATPITGFPFSLDFKNQKPPVDLNNVLYAMKPSDDGLG